MAAVAAANTSAKPGLGSSFGVITLQQAQWTKCTHCDEQRALSMEPIGSIDVDSSFLRD